MVRRLLVAGLVQLAIQAIAAQGLVRLDNGFIVEFEDDPENMPGVSGLGWFIPESY